jgi:serine/threonine-protein kinase
MAFSGVAMSAGSAIGTLLGPYLLRRSVGAGGMAEVFEAEHTVLKKTVAVKVLHPTLARNQSLVQRFVREGVAAARLRHPNIVDVTDVGTAGEVPYLVLEYLHGTTLEDVLLRTGQLSPAEAAALMLPILDAVEHAHAAGVLHRDLKPSNIFVALGTDGRPIPKVLDFGVSKLFNEPDATTTQTGALLGTPLYCAPEQAMGRRDIDGRVDQYSLGAVLYGCLTGRAPFDPNQSLLEILTNVSRGTFPAPSQWTSIPPDFEHIVLTAMATDRDARFASFAHMRAALAPYAAMETGHRDWASVVFGDELPVATPIDSAPRSHPGSSQVRSRSEHPIAPTMAIDSQAANLRPADRSSSSSSVPTLAMDSSAAALSAAGQSAASWATGIPGSVSHPGASHVTTFQPSTQAPGPRWGSSSPSPACSRSSSAPRRASSRWATSALGDRPHRASQGRASQGRAS